MAAARWDLPGQHAAGSSVKRRLEINRSGRPHSSVGSPAAAARGSTCSVACSLQPAPQQARQVCSAAVGAAVQHAALARGSSSTAASCPAAQLTTMCHASLVIFCRLPAGRCVPREGQCRPLWRQHQHAPHWPEPGGGRWAGWGARVSGWVAGPSRRGWRGWRGNRLRDGLRAAAARCLATPFASMAEVWCCRTPCP